MAKEAFELIDIDHDGFLTKDEVLKALMNMNKQGVTLIPATMEMVENMMKEVDEDGDGQVSNAMEWHTLLLNKRLQYLTDPPTQLLSRSTRRRLTSTSSPT